MKKMENFQYISTGHVFIRLKNRYYIPICIMKQAQVTPETIIGGIIFLIIISALIPVLQEATDDITCKNEKASIENLQNQLQICQNQLAAQAQRTNNAMDNLQSCQDLLSTCEANKAKCQVTYYQLQEECENKEQPINRYPIINVFQDYIILFDIFVLYHIHIIGLFFVVGISFTMKLFEIDIHIKVLNKKNQRKVVKYIREFLIDHPNLPLIIMLVIILITNIPNIISALQ
jgi:hypothetical protein